MIGSQVVDLALNDESIIADDGRMKMLTGSGLSKLYATNHRLAVRGSGLNQLGGVRVDQNVEVATVDDGIEVSKSSTLAFTIGDLIRRLAQIYHYSS